MATFFGGIQFENFEGLTKMPQKAASAWAKVTELVGASYKPLLYCGKQLVRGTNHLFIAEQTLITIGQETRIVAIVVNEFNGDFNIVPEEFKVIFG